VKLIKQVRLEFREGTSDKVYEVDLCEVGPDRYVVNFRYGRRGTTLRDGSKTPAPVTQAKAEKIYNDLVASKVKGGYRDVSGGAAPPPAAAPAAAEPEEEPVLDALPVEAREQAVLARLRQGFAEPPRSAPRKRPWRLSRAIWRAGELRLRSAEPLLLNLLEQVRRNKAARLRKSRSQQIDEQEIDSLLGQSFLHGRYGMTQWSESFTPPEDLFLYALAWSLGRCGSAASVPALRGLRSESWEPVGRIATAALLLLLEGRERAALVAELTGTLPGTLARLCQSGPADALRQALQEHLDSADPGPMAVLDTLYLIDNEHARAALLDVLRTVPLQSAFFQAVRHIFKLAELRLDAEMFGVLAHRFETTKKEASTFRVEVPAVRYSRYRGNLSREQVRLYPFTSDRTRFYLRIRIWRTLRRLGEEGDPDYVRMAAGVLLPFTDADARDVVTWSEYEYEQSRWGWRPARSHTRHRDRFGPYWAFNQILHRTSPRYQPVRHKGTFICRRDYEPGGHAPTVREEAFPKLWEAAPEVLMHLLEASRCLPVHEFAAKALRACPEFCRRLEVADLIRLLETPYEVTVELGMDLAVERYDPAHPDHALVLALAHSGLTLARVQARKWIGEQRGHFTQDHAFLAALVTSPQADTQAFARELLRQTAFTPGQAEAMVGRLIALLRSFRGDEGARARDTAQTLQLVFAAQMRRLGPEVIRDLLEHPLAEVRQFAGELLLGHDTLARNPPEDIIARLLQDSAASVRGVGVRLLGQLPEETLKQSLDLLVALSRHELEDFRDNIRPIVKRLADQDPDFGRRIARKLMEALLVPGAPQGIPSHTARILREDLRGHLGGVPADLVWKLLQSRSPPAQEVGGLLLAANVQPEDLSVAEIVKLASHDILSVREASWQMCRSSLDRLAADMATASRLVDARWEDSRQFAFGLLRDAFHRGQLTADILVSFCDSVRPDVQAFGREMITRLFEEKDGPEYAVKLSEHPSTSMQMFAANFLEQYAGTSTERLRQLGFYFHSVLSRVNQGRVAKERVLGFLEKAAEAGPDSARVVAEVLGRQSATIAIGDRARAIQILTRIHAAHPDVKVPLSIKPVEVRNGV
jgi:hypothetical protein